MITESSYYALYYRKGGYLCHRGDQPGGVYWLTTDPSEANRARNPDAVRRLTREWYWTPGDFAVVSAPVCGCCGSPDVIRHPAGHFTPYRCEAHADRNPCAIEGCTRTDEAPKMNNGHPWLANNQVLCSKHWRAYVPPRSRERRLYHQHFRRAKRLGWNDDRVASFRAFWTRLVNRARSRSTEGFVDEASINRLFGWGQEGGG